MQLALSRPGAELFVPDGAAPDAALSRTTHLGVGAHADDLELMAMHGILECFRRSDRWFTGVVVTDGAGSTRGANYQDLKSEEFAAVRRLEQKKAAYVGEYGAQILLDHPSAAARDPFDPGVVADLRVILAATKPEVVYTHNLADKHETHVSVALRVLAACRELPPEERPKRLLGCEVWRDLDWLNDVDKVALPVSAREHLQAALTGVFDSQIDGAKRYDLAARGRSRANAVYFEAREGDREDGLAWAMDLTPLLAGGDPAQYVDRFVAAFREDVVGRLRRLG